MWLGSPSLQRLEAWLQGYRVGAMDASVPVDRGQPSFGYFHRFVQKKLGFSESTAGWMGMICARVQDDEGPALARFYELFDEFRALGAPRRIAETSDPQFIIKPYGTSLFIDETNGTRSEGPRLPTHIELRAFPPPLGALLVMRFAWGTDEEFVGASEEDGYTVAERWFGVPRHGWRGLV